MNIKELISNEDFDFKIESGKMIININADIEKLLVGNKLENKTVGDVVTIGDIEYIVLEQMDGKTACITKDFAFTAKFGETNDFRNEIGIRAVLQGWLRNNVLNKIGDGTVMEQEIDLISLDGLDDYGKITDKIGLLSIAQYQKYHKILGLKSNYSDWWWLCTPYSVQSNGHFYSVCVVLSNGVIDWRGCGFSCGVRPFVIFDSSTSVENGMRG